MSNLMHKVKDVLTGHHDSDNKESSRDSNVTKKMDDTRDAYGTGNNWSSNANTQDPTSTGDYGSNTMGSDNYGASGYTGTQPNTKLPGVMEDTSNTYGSTNTGSGNYGSSGLGSGTQDSMTNRMGDTTNAYGGSNIGSDTYDSANKAKDYGTGYNQTKPIGSETYDDPPTGNTGSGLNTDSYGSDTKDYGTNALNTGTGESQMSNKMGSELDNRATYGTGTGTGQTGGLYTSNYGDDVGSGNKYNTRSKASSDMPSQLGTQADSGMDNQGFGGAAAGGSSYNAPEAGKRRSSGPHSSNLLNKLDPRVRSSDYEGNAMGNQRGN
ncbi:hypothetical protein N7466_009158 [Penicillium verhagenii]|uniref:uncharacterized protein n=1 Tax=Penicillium verhagenii TaxID=1562060 RepID=UPI0025451669|nr:uncharacterized protein N7466_009158 [Penicillium verhagenii]KAJ5920832.1 hypothetical protein N7466_009158 [Penicillium verhagenii]